VPAASFAWANIEE
jgi:hypothetical protein